jgi:hypothetical protein
MDTRGRDLDDDGRRLLRVRAAAEQPLIRRVSRDLSPRTAIVAVQASPPLGAKRLKALLTGVNASAEALTVRHQGTHG